MAFNIAPQALGDVLTALAPAKSIGLGAEKRKATRIRIESQVTLWIVADKTPGQKTSALTRDISYSGIGLLMGHKLDPGATFILQLPQLKANPLLIVCRVTFSKELAQNLYGVGAEFVSLLAHKPASAEKSPGEKPGLAAATQN